MFFYRFHQNDQTGLKRGRITIEHITYYMLCAFLFRVMIGIDSYGVDHNGFSTRDELAYQFARDKREGKLLDFYQSQGINDNYPQLGTEFWGDDAADNYGFGRSEIKENIDNHPALNQTPFPKMVEINSRGSDDEQNNLSILDNVKIFAHTAIDTVAPYTPTYYLGYGVGKINSDLQDPYGYINSVNKIIDLNNVYNPMKVNDKYKHAMINCLMAQRGTKSEKVSQIASGLKENYDVLMDKNTSQSSDEDMEANIHGRKIGRNYPKENCQELISKKYKP